MNGISDSVLFTTLGVALHVMIQVLLIIRVLLKPHRDPTARLTWVVVVIALPIAGIFAYLLLGETNIGRKRAERMRLVLEQMPHVSAAPGIDALKLRPSIPERHAHLFQVGQSISGFQPIGGNRAHLPPDSNAVVESLVADIDAAQDHVHVLFYIWLADNNGLEVAQALMRAAKRGVTCRAMADDLGSRAMIHSEHWRSMQAAGVKLARALPIGNPILRVLGGRIDLRNHRKIVVIDDWITYCGSQNCADPEFRVKAKYAPWVDMMIRFEGPIARQNQHLFAGDWMAHVEDDIDALLRRPIPSTAESTNTSAASTSISAQVVGTGPTVRYSAMPELFEALIYSARRSLVITTPYYVPDESMQAALCASARRGVETLIVFPQRNDSRIVAAASRSYYADLLAAGVRIYEYVGGLLHTKSLTLDGEISLIGSANMDRRSFDLNYENNILLYDPDLTQQIRARQQHYLDSALLVDAEQVADWPRHRRLVNNTVAMLGPVL
ncbi:cardiolipin synthase [Lamprobacter modestohalophilus]|uniref:cardiolipin synthase n=1 Tax=Lamprobacter modestohalophilus TaxID=1064514 RepID=UPI002ADEE1EB|nr:cardiolipin synthase [Lamprobacter modestohalophilus]MEA1050429.1 cardiolipin synthase [Lamprobacter modestohalophilus]